MWQQIVLVVAAVGTIGAGLVLSLLRGSLEPMLYAAAMVILVSIAFRLRGLFGHTPGRQSILPGQAGLNRLSASGAVRTNRTR